MKEIVVNAAIRSKPGVRSELKNLRNSKMVPAVIYGSDRKPVNISVNAIDIEKVLKEARNSIITIKYNNAEEKVIIKELHKHVVTDKIIHVDFHRVMMDKKIDIKVPIKFIGEAYGVKTQGGLIEYDMREITVRCLPANIPANIEVDLTNLKIGDSIRIKDLKSEKFEIRENPENIIVSVISAKEEIATPAATQTEQPEVIEKGKKAEGAEEKTDSSSSKDSEKEPKKGDKK
ncbi:MAG: 50S ribosomal protein L25 [Elusimicrobiota bacterium]